jgi:hypothetical protein
MSRNSDEPTTKESYKNYCKISYVIITAKNRYYNNLELHSLNKQKLWTGMRGSYPVDRYGQAEGVWRLSPC